MNELPPGQKTATKGGIALQALEEEQALVVYRPET
jgi:hypothetical protein